MDHEFSYIKPIKYGIIKFIDNFKHILIVNFLVIGLAFINLLVNIAAYSSKKIAAHMFSVQWPFIPVDQIILSMPVSVSFIIVTFLQVILIALLYAGLLKWYFDLYDNKIISITQAFNFEPRLLRYVGAALLYYILVFLGLLLFIAPGIILAMRYYAAPYLAIDKNQTISESFAQSAELTNGYKMQLFGFELWLGVLSSFLGMNLLTMGPLLLARLYVYRHYLLSKD
jgi:hypothetical protein